MFSVFFGRDCVNTGLQQRLKQRTFDNKKWRIAQIFSYFVKKDLQWLVQVVGTSKQLLVNHLKYQ